jgi:hypothetical protein
MPTTPGWHRQLRHRLRTAQRAGGLHEGGGLRGVDREGGAGAQEGAEAAPPPRIKRSEKKQLKIGDERKTFFYFGQSGNC